MTLLDLFRPTRALALADSTDVQASLVDPSTYPIATPWSDCTLERVIYSDIFGTDAPSNTRSSAMQNPTVARARNRIVNAAQKLPLVDLPAGVNIPDRAKQPTWLYRTSDGSSPQHRLAWTVDDLIFYGWSLWWKVPGNDGFPLHAGRVNMGAWSVNADNQVEIEGVPQDPATVILIPGFHEGILTYGATTLADSSVLRDLVRKRLKNPIPATELHQTEGPDLAAEDRRELVESWIVARERGDNVGYTPKSIQLNTHGSDIEAQLMIEARNADSVDIARMMNVSASLVDATAPKASLNYETTTGRNQEFLDHDASLYLDPITARLSLDDVTPMGHRIAVDTTALTGTPSPTGPTLED